jgi:hypothetical protein
MENQAEMIDYAYKNENTKRSSVYQKTQIYKEELFARFIPINFRPMEW